MDARSMVVAAPGQRLRVKRAGAVKNILVSGLGAVGLALAVGGAVLMGIGGLSAPDPSGFNRAVGGFGLLILVIGAVIYLVARSKSKQNP